MRVRFYHQVGHCSTWNLESFAADGCGDGLILSPVHQNRLSVERLHEDIQRQSLFDPQYYLPNSTKAKLATYDFFPEQISNGFSTANFPLVSRDSAERCVAFQVAQRFEGIVIPMRFVDQLATRYFEKQEEYTVQPFLKALARHGGSQPVYLTLPLTSGMLQDEEFRTRLLNWVTGFPEISGVYVLVNDERATKQVRSAQFLTAYLDFTFAIAAAGLKPILGHLNSENLLFSVIEQATITSGAFENTRMFSMDKFIESDEERRAPKPRMYLPALFNWIQFDQARQIKEENASLWERIYSPSAYGDTVLAATAEPYFNQPGLYKHHFVCVERQVKALSELSAENRYRLLREQLRSAGALYEEISNMPVDLDFHGNGAHLQPWLDSLNSVYRRYLKG